MECPCCPVLESCKKINKNQERDRCCFGVNFQKDSVTCQDCGWVVPCEKIKNNSGEVIIFDENN